MKKILICFLVLASIPAIAGTKELHSCSAICVERINIIPGGWQTLPVSETIKSVIVSSLGNTRYEATERLLQKCRETFSFDAKIAGGISYSESLRAEGSDLVSSNASAPFAGEAAPFGRTSNLNCDSIQL